MTPEMAYQLVASLELPATVWAEVMRRLQAETAAEAAATTADNRRLLLLLREYWITFGAIQGIEPYLARLSAVPHKSDCR